MADEIINLKARIRDALLDDDLISEIADRVMESRAKETSLDVPKLIEALRDSHKRLSVNHDFKVGDLVRWKPGLRNRKYPAADEPGIVLKILDAPVIDANEKPYSSFYREPLDIILGLIDEEGDLIAFHFDKRRFELLK
jgi:hypothetical protein